MTSAPCSSPPACKPSRLGTSRPWLRVGGGGPISRSIPASAYVEHFDPELPHHGAWLLAVLEQLVAHERQALEGGGTLRRLWTEH